MAEQGQSDEALQLLRSRIDAGDFIGAVLDFAVAVLSAKGRAEEAIDLCRRAALNPSADYDSATYATCKAAELLVEAGRTEEAITWLKTIAEDKDLVHATRFGGIQVIGEAARRAAKLMAEAGRAEAAITWLQACARMGVFDALQIAVQLLSGVGREEEAQSLRRYGWEPDGTIASSWVAPPPPDRPPTMGSVQEEQRIDQFSGAREPVTKQVTTTPGTARRSATSSDTTKLPICGNPTRRDAVRRNWHAW